MGPRLETGRTMDSDAKLQILIEALSAAGASALAIDERGGVVISTMVTLYSSRISLLLFPSVSLAWAMGRAW